MLTSQPLGGPRAEEAAVLGRGCPREGLELDEERRGLQTTRKKISFCARKSFPSGQQNPSAVTSSEGRKLPTTKGMATAA